MYQLIITEDFVNILRDLPLKYLSVLLNSFVSITKIDDEEALKLKDHNFLLDLLDQIKNQELE